MTALPYTQLSGNYTSLYSSDDCLVSFTYAGPHGASAFPTFGIEAEFSFAAGMQALTLGVDLELPSYQLGPAVVLIKNHETDQFVRVWSVYPDALGKVEETLTPHTDPAPYLDPEGRLFLRVIVGYDPMMEIYEENVDMDKLEIEPY